MWSIHCNGQNQHTKFKEKWSGSYNTYRRSENRSIQGINQFTLCCPCFFFFCHTNQQDTSIARETLGFLSDNPLTTSEGGINASPPFQTYINETPHKNVTDSDHGQYSMRKENRCTPLSKDSKQQRSNTDITDEVNITIVKIYLHCDSKLLQDLILKWPTTLEDILFRASKHTKSEKEENHLWSEFAIAVAGGTI